MNGIEFKNLKTGDIIRVEKGPNKGKIFVLKKDKWLKLFMMSFCSQLSWSTIIIGKKSYKAENCSIITKEVR